MRHQEGSLVTITEMTHLRLARGLTVAMLCASTLACDSARPEAGGAEASDRAAFTVEELRKHLVVPDANVTLGGGEANGLKLQSLSCVAKKRPLLGAMAMIAAFAEHKAALDACVPKGAVAVVTWSGAAGGVTDLKAFTTLGPKADACVTAALESAKSPIAGQCAAAVLFGDRDGADAAAKALSTEADDTSAKK